MSGDVDLDPGGWRCYIADVVITSWARTGAERPQGRSVIPTRDREAAAAAQDRPLKNRQSRGRRVDNEARLSTMQLEVIDSPTQAEVQQIVQRLVAWNLTVAPPEEHQKLAVIARSEDDLIGGAVGHTHWTWLFVSHLWVAEDHRTSGLGTQLMHTIESTAISRGAQHAHVDTYDFQAVTFYENLGYEQFGVLHDYPPGYSRHFLRRSLT